MKKGLLILIICAPILLFADRDNLFSIEFPILVTKTKLADSGDDNVFVNKSKYSIDIGAGMSLNITHWFKFKIGLKYLSKCYELEYLIYGRSSSHGYHNPMRISKQINMSYIAPYTRIGFELKHFFFDTGFDLGVKMIYKSSTNYLNEKTNYSSIGPDNGVAVERKTYIDLVMGLGPKFLVKDVITLRPTFEISAPLVSPQYIVENFRYNQDPIDAEVHVFLFKFGLNITVETGMKKALAKQQQAK